VSLMNELEQIHWLGHASFFFTDQASGNRIYYVDPFDLHQQNLAKGDLIFITHSHPDYLSLNDLKKLLKDDSVVIATPDSLSRIDISHEQKQAVIPNQSYTVKNFSFQTIPAYNIHPERLQAHPKANNWVGYIFTINDKKIYHAGDTDFIPEMKVLKNLNLAVALIPIGGTYTMDVTEAIQAANAISAKITIPMHYKRLLGENYKDAEEKLKKEVTNSTVVILKELQ